MIELRSDVTTAIPGKVLGEKNPQRAYNIYWCIDYSFVFDDHSVAVRRADGMEIEGEKRDYRLFHPAGYHDLCTILKDSTRPRPDIIVLEDLYKISSANHRALKYDNSPAKKKSDDYLREKFPEDYRPTEIMPWHKRLYRRLFGTTEEGIEKKEKPKTEIQQVASDAIDFIALRLSDPESYCKQAIGSLTEGAEEISRLMRTANPNGKVLMVDTGLVGVWSADEGLWHRMFGLYHDLVEETNTKYDNLFMIREQGIFFNKHIVEKCLRGFDMIIEGEQPSYFW